MLVILAPHLSVGDAAAMSDSAALGAVFAVLNAVFAAAAYIQIRRLTSSETTSSIVLYFSLISSLCGLATLPLGWVWPDTQQLSILLTMGFFGGVGQIFMTESYRYAQASLTAPFDYTSIVWAVILGYIVFGEAPGPSVWAGSAIVIAAGLFVIWRERQLMLQRRLERDNPPPSQVSAQRMLVNRVFAAPAAGDQPPKALKVMMVRVSWMPGMICTFSLTKWPISVPSST